MTSIYLMSNGEFVKVGISRDPARRIASLSTGSPLQIDLLDQWNVAAEAARAAEASIHRLLKPWRARGEWFSCRQYIARLAIESVVLPSAEAAAWAADCLTLFESDPTLRGKRVCWEAMQANAVAYEAAVADLYQRDPARADRYFERSKERWS